jgi:hypothetical protein
LILNLYALSPDLPGVARHFDFGKGLVKRGFLIKYLGENMK